MEKNKSLYELVTSEENIYLAIYEANNAICEKELLSNDEQERLLKLKDPFNKELINKTITDVKKNLEVLLNSNCKFMKTNVFLKPKSYEETEKKIEFRPIHSASLINQITCIALLNVLLYDLDENNKLSLSSLSQVIPNNFYGNIPSIKAEELFEPWQEKYKEYARVTSESYTKFVNNKKYKWEITLDLKSFFPSINPKIVFGYIKQKLKFRFISEEDKQTLDNILRCLLYFKVNNAKYIDKQYYEDNDVDEYYSKGIVQGLPQSYFFGNLCMVEIAKKLGSEFPGEAYYYVDDSVIYTNKCTKETFGNIIKKVQKDINDELKKYIDICNNEKIYFMKRIDKFNKKMKYMIQFHSEGKSQILEIEKEKEGKQFINQMNREASLIGSDLNSLFSDEEISISLNKLEILYLSIDAEMERVRRDENHENYKYYYKVLSRLKRYFKFRYLIFNEENSESTIIKKVEEQINVLKKSKEEFFDNYKEDIFIAQLAYVSKKIKNDELHNNLLKIIENMDMVIFKGFELSDIDYSKISYFRKVIESLNPKMNFEKLFFDKYSSLKRIVLSTISFHPKQITETKEKLTRKILDANYKSNRTEENLLMYKTDTYIKEKLYTIVKNNSDNLQRMILNTIISILFEIDISDNINISKIEKRKISYDEYRLVIYLRNNNFRYNKFFEFINNKGIDLNGSPTLDYGIMEVIDLFNANIREPDKIDDLILIHKYTCDMWKNGSKYLHFYTLHNQEHAVELIKQSNKILKTIDYFQISKNDYYCLYIACYLHDISMVIHPNLEEIFLSNSEQKANLILEKFKMQFVGVIENSGSSYKINEIFELIDNRKIKNIIINLFKEIDSLFENHVRGNHTKDSSNFIKSSSDIKFIDDVNREIVADISEGHGFDIKDIYNIKSNARNSMFSLKYSKIILRLADLLDMSKDRVAYSILLNNANNMSKTSKFHWVSHCLIDRCELKVEYVNRKIKEKENSEYKSFIAANVIDEIIKLIIYVNVENISEMDCEKEICNYINCISVKKDEVIIDIASDKKNCKCNNKNFICSWLAEKNSYLYNELYALQKYLERSNNYYNTKFKVEIKTEKLSKIGEDHSNFIRSYLAEE